MKAAFFILAFTGGLALAIETEKPTLVEFYAAWCVPCLEMEKKVFKDSAVKKEIKKYFNFVRIDTEKNQDFFCEGETLPIQDCMALWEVPGIPAFAVLDKEGKLTHLSVGEFGKKEFLNFLKAIRK
ncbi:MAG: thioredoxin family protein [Fibromonadales bacterium]|nr:thioredoxin family protein [Fibromonadales bacterium]